MWWWWWWWHMHRQRRNWQPHAPMPGAGCRAGLASSKYLCPAHPCPFRPTNMSKRGTCYEDANNIHHVNLGIQSINRVREPLSIIHQVFHYHELLCYAYMLGLQLYVKQNARQASCRRIYKPLAMETSHSLTISAAQTPLSVL